jgi:hypothetical protein
VLLRDGGSRRSISESESNWADNAKMASNFAAYCSCSLGGKSQEPQEIARAKRVCEGRELECVVTKRFLNPRISVLVLPKRVGFGVETVSCESSTPKTYIGSK